MKVIERATPLPMPTDWEPIGKTYRETYSKILETKEYKDFTNIDLALLVPKSERGEDFWVGRGVIELPSKQDCYALFETIIFKKEWSQYFFDPDFHVLDSGGGAEYTYEYLYKQYAFVDCWGKLHRSYPSFAVPGYHKWLWSVCYSAWNGFLSGAMDIDACYASIDDEHSYHEEISLNRLKELEAM